MADQHFDVDRSKVPKANLLFEWDDCGRIGHVWVEVAGEVVAELTHSVVAGGASFRTGRDLALWTVEFAADLRPVKDGGDPMHRTLRDPP